MREIKFRGKDVDGKWRHGYLLKDKKLFYISVPRTIIGQYTGLKDKNDVEIYEGDIVYRKIIYCDKPNGGRYKIVKFNQDNARFNINKKISVNYEVIGNIYDNKELLKEEGK